MIKVDRNIGPPFKFEMSIRIYQDSNHDLYRLSGDGTFGIQGNWMGKVEWQVDPIDVSKGRYVRRWISPHGNLSYEYRSSEPPEPVDVYINEDVFRKTAQRRREEAIRAPIALLEEAKRLDLAADARDKELSELLGVVVDTRAVVALDGEVFYGKDSYLALEKK